MGRFATTLFSGTQCCNNGTMLQLFETVLRLKSSSRFKSSRVTSPLVPHELLASAMVF